MTSLCLELFKLALSDTQACRFSSSMLEDGRTPYMWENGDQSKDMIPRLRRIIMDAGLHLKQISNTMALEDAIRKRKGQFTVKNPSREAEDDANAAVEDGVIDDDGEESESGSSQTPWHHLIQLILTLSGHAKITAERPSTSFFGNDGIYQALKMLQNSNPDVAIHGEPFMGKPKERVSLALHALHTCSEALINTSTSLLRVRMRKVTSKFAFRNAIPNEQ